MIQVIGLKTKKDTHFREDFSRINKNTKVFLFGISLKNQEKLRRTTR
jgi:hypothetical protein